MLALEHVPQLGSLQCESVNVVERRLEGLAAARPVEFLGGGHILGWCALQHCRPQRRRPLAEGVQQRARAEQRVRRTGPQERGKRPPPLLHELGVKTANCLLLRERRDDHAGPRLEELGAQFQEPVEAAAARDATRERELTAAEGVEDVLAHGARQPVAREAAGAEALAQGIPNLDVHHLDRQHHGGVLLHQRRRPVELLLEHRWAT
mmetsp:Transcript_17024/g.43611  ORF Transcript_17024/g.43611 Transcript_17024/m.43611 type:complete len:207 (+) Transcript_17024:933-1553(+)